MIRSCKAGLKALGKKCHLILANGAFSKKNDNDENKAVRAETAHSSWICTTASSTRAHFAHNKFLVCCDSVGQASARPLGQHELDDDRAVHAGQ